MIQDLPYMPVPVTSATKQFPVTDTIQQSQKARLLFYFTDLKNRLSKIEQSGQEVPGKIFVHPFYLYLPKDTSAYISAFYDNDGEIRVFVLEGELISTKKLLALTPNKCFRLNEKIVLSSENEKPLLTVDPNHEIPVGRLVELIERQFLNGIEDTTAIEKAINFLADCIAPIEINGKILKRL
jgi:hypothetical protein